MLYYRGYSIEELAANSSYEEVAYLLVNAKMPSGAELAEFKDAIGAGRRLPQYLIDVLRALPKDTTPMEALQASIALLGSEQLPREETATMERTKERGVSIIAKAPTIVAAWEQIRNGRQPIDPSPELTHAADFLRMLHGKKAPAAHSKYLDTALILHADHTFNASTFTARVIASTRATIYSAVSGAVGSLSGELHGGANVQVMRSLQEIGEIERAEAWVKDQLANGRRVMGMGHAVYKTTDPRAKILRKMADDITAGTPERKWFELTERMRESTEKEFRRLKNRDLYPNVDLYSGTLYRALGIPADLYTTVFAISRCAGWVAHVIEEKHPEPPVKPILYRPTVSYAGQYCGDEGCRYVKIEERA